MFKTDLSMIKVEMVVIQKLLFSSGFHIYDFLPGFGIFYFCNEKKPQYCVFPLPFAL